MIPTNAPALTPLLFLFTGLLIPLAAFKFKKLAYWMALTATALASAAALSNIFRVLDGGAIHYRFGGWPPPIGIEYVLDPLSAFVTSVINVIAFIVLLHARRTVEADLPEGKRVPYYALAMLMMSGFNGIVMTGDFFNLYVFLDGVNDRPGVAFDGVMHQPGILWATTRSSSRAAIGCTTSC